MLLNEVVTLDYQKRDCDSLKDKNCTATGEFSEATLLPTTQPQHPHR